MTVNALVTTSVIFAGISVILQTTSFIIPGWLIIEAKDFSINMALWYVTFCERMVRNLTEPLETCEHFSYNGFVNKRNDGSILHLRKYTLCIRLFWEVFFFNFPRKDNI